MPPSPPPERSGGRARGDLAVRFASAAVLVPVAIATAWLGGIWFIFLWLGAGLVLLWEWTNLVIGRDAAVRITASGGAGLTAGAAALWLGSPPIAAALMLAGALAAAAAAPAGRRLWAAGGAAYGAAIVMAPVTLRFDPQFGFMAIMLLFAVVWATDIAAYFGGRLIGGARLSPTISPSKTWSGALSGGAAALVAGMAIAVAMGLSSILWLGLMCMMLSVCAQAGDLFESAVKRRFGAKDSSKLIPGHGGLMDRLDGFVAAAVAAALIGLARGGFAEPARGLLIW